MTETQAFSEYFDKLDAKLAGSITTREQFYIAKDFLKVIQNSPSNIDWRKSPFFRPLSNTFRILCHKSNLNEAKQLGAILGDSIKPETIVNHVFENYKRNTVQEDSEKDIETTTHYIELIRFLDQASMFFSRLGFSPLNPGILETTALKKIVRSNWIQLIQQFLSCNTKAKCYGLMDLILSCLTNNHLFIGAKPPDEIIYIQFLDWLTKRQSLLLLTLVKLVRMDTDKSILKKPRILNDLIIQVANGYETFLLIQKFSIEKHLRIALKTLQFIENEPYYHDFLAENLISQIGKIDHLYSDIESLYREAFIIKYKFDACVKSLTLSYFQDA